MQNDELTRQAIKQEKINRFLQSHYAKESERSKEHILLHIKYVELLGENSVLIETIARLYEKLHKAEFFPHKSLSQVLSEELLNHRLRFIIWVFDKKNALPRSFHEKIRKNMEFYISMLLLMPSQFFVNEINNAITYKNSFLIRFAELFDLVPLFSISNALDVRNVFNELMKSGHQSDSLAHSFSPTFWQKIQDIFPELDSLDHSLSPIFWLKIQDMFPNKYSFRIEKRLLEHVPPILDAASKIAKEVIEIIAASSTKESVISRQENTQIPDKANGMVPAIEANVSLPDANALVPNLKPLAAEIVKQSDVPVLAMPDFDDASKNDDKQNEHNGADLADAAIEPIQQNLVLRAMPEIANEPISLLQLKAKLRNIIVARINTFNVAKKSTKKIFDEFIKKISAYHGGFVTYLVAEDCEQLKDLLAKTAVTLNLGTPSWEKFETDIKHFLINYNIVAVSSPIKFDREIEPEDLADKNDVEIQNTKYLQIEQIIAGQIKSNYENTQSTKNVATKIEPTIASTLVYLHTHTILTKFHTPGDDLNADQARYILACHLELPTGFKPTKVNAQPKQANDVVATLTLSKWINGNITGLFELTKIKENAHEYEVAIQLFKQLPASVKQLFIENSNEKETQSISLLNQIAPRVIIKRDSLTLRDLIAASKLHREHSDEPIFYLLLPPQKIKKNNKKKKSAIRTIRPQAIAAPVAATSTSLEVEPIELRSINPFKNKKRKIINNDETVFTPKNISPSKAEADSDEVTDEEKVTTSYLSLFDFLTSINERNRQVIKRTLAEARIQISFDQFAEYKELKRATLRADEQNVIRNYPALQNRPYQIEGVIKLAQEAKSGIGSLLADEMGLGKTIQAGHLIKFVLTSNPSQNHILVIVPKSVLEKWHRELIEKCHIKESDIAFYYGKKREHILKHNRRVILSTYDTVEYDLNCKRSSQLQKICGYLSIKQLNNLDTRAVSSQEKQRRRKNLTIDNNCAAMKVFNFLTQRDIKVLSKKGALLALPTDKQLDKLYALYPDLSIPREKLVEMLTNIKNSFQLTGVIYDECHTIREQRLDLFLPINRVLARSDVKGFRVGMTGTPCQNNIKELSWLHFFLNPLDTPKPKDIENADRTFKNIMVNLSEQASELCLQMDSGNNEYKQLINTLLEKFRIIFNEYKKLAAQLAKRQIRRRNEDVAKENEAIVGQEIRSAKKSRPNRIDTQQQWQLSSKQEELFRSIKKEHIDSACRGYAFSFSEENPDENVVNGDDVTEIAVTHVGNDDQETVSEKPEGTLPGALSDNMKGLRLINYLSKACNHPVLVEPKHAAVLFAKNRQWKQRNVMRVFLCFLLELGVE